MKLIPITDAVNATDAAKSNAIADHTEKKDTSNLGLFTRPPSSMSYDQLFRIVVYFSSSKCSDKYNKIADTRTALVKEDYKSQNYLTRAELKSISKY